MYEAHHVRFVHCTMYEAVRVSAQYGSHSVRI